MNDTDREARGREVGHNEVTHNERTKHESVLDRATGRAALCRVRREDGEGAAAAQCDQFQ